MEIYIPDGIKEQNAFSRTTHLAVAAHHDDIEIMAYDGILKCFGKNDMWFSGVVVTDGSGSPRSGIYENCSDKEMMLIRKEEQKKAAVIGDYSMQVLMNYPSSYVKSPNEKQAEEEIGEIINKTRPQIIYTHNLADKHETHIGVAVKTINALRKLDYLPEKVYGCEVWRGLDWMTDSEKIKLDVSGKPHLENALVGVFDSQICGGKRYDLATAGRRLANATYSESHNIDNSGSVIYAMDLTPLIYDKTLDIGGYVEAYIESFKNSVLENINKIIG